MRRVPKTRNPYRSSLWDKIGVSLTAETANARTATITFQDVNGRPVNERVHAEFYLTTNLTTLAPGAAASSDFAAGANGAYLVTAAGRSGIVVSNASGVVDLVITDTAVRTVYLVMLRPDGGIAVSPAIAFA
jgi:hypothetical protein